MNVMDDNDVSNSHDVDNHEQRNALPSYSSVFGDDDEPTFFCGDNGNHIFLSLARADENVSNENGTELEGYGNRPGVQTVKDVPVNPVPHLDVEMPERLRMSEYEDEMEVTEDDDEERDESEDENQSCSRSEISEENENDPEILYWHPTYAKEVFHTLEEMKQSCILTDLTLITASGDSYLAHSLVLAAVSSVIQHLLQERDERKEAMYLSLAPEVSHLGICGVLEFAYTGTVQKTESVAQIQTAAFHLEVSGLVELCKALQQERRDDEGKMFEESERMSGEEQMKVSLRSIRQLWEERVGCDLEVEAEGRIFRAHRAFLAASSDYFHAMFLSGMRESQQASVSLLLIGAPELETLLHCCYSGALCLNWGRIFQLTSTALQFQFQPALSLCCSFLEMEIDCNKCLDVAVFAETYQMSDLSEIADDFALRHFEEFAATQEFLYLPVEKLKMYLRSERLNVTTELSVFKAVISWIEANPKRRVKKAKELMGHVLFHLMTFTEFKEVKAITSWPQVSAKDLYTTLLQEFCSNTIAANSGFRSYLPKQTLVLVGGEKITEDLDKRLPCREIWFGNSFRNYVGIMKRIEWRVLANLPDKPRFGHCVCVLNEKLYVVGGRHYYGKNDIMKCTYRYDPNQNIWQRLADMHEQRCSFALVILEEKMYAIGGDKNSEVNADSVEVYCPITDSWSYVHPLDQPRSDHAASVWNGYIFISGGFNNRYQCLTSMTLYHPDKGTSELADMTQSRAQHCMETFQDHLYVGGGVTDANGKLVDQLACEIYDPVHGFWNAIMPLSVPHVSAASAVLEGKIYILGGYRNNDHSDTKLIHRYDPKAKHWENMCGTPGPNTYLAACVLPLPSHLRQ